MSRDALAEIDVEKLMLEIQARVRRRAQGSSIPNGVATGASVRGDHSFPTRTSSAAKRPEPLLMARSLQPLAEALALYDQKIGLPTPTPPSLRGRLGNFLMRVIGRILWWYTRQLQARFEADLRLQLEQDRAIQGLEQMSGGVAERTDLLEGKISALESSRRALEHRFDEEVANQRNRATNELENVREGLVCRMELLERRMSDFVNQEASGLEETKCTKTLLADQIGQVSNRLSELGLFAHRIQTQVSLQDRRISILLEEARKHQVEPTTHLEKLAEKGDDFVDGLYVAFEDAFRGTRDEIKAKQSVYIPFLKQHGIGSSEMPLLDLGCGRGEWLELMRANEMVARGLDRNTIMLSQCRELGLEAHQGDALTYLRKLPESSLGAVSAFHLVEHLAFEIVLQMVDEILRVLKPGGIVLFETPNPGNILVGSHTFYLDPTHLRPLPSAMLRFFVEARGFCDVHVRELNPYHSSILLPEDATGVAKRINDYFYGAQDYAVIGRKP